MERYGRSLRDDGFSSGSSSLMFPPRLYTCGFCKRVFKSAQALGGHMNVHRRDRARLRQYSPPWDHPPLPSNPSPNPNPNPSPRPNPVSNLNFSPPPCTTENKLSPVTCAVLPSLLSPRPDCFTVTTAIAPSPAVLPRPFRPRCVELKAFFEVKRQKGFVQDDHKVNGVTGRDEEVVALDLEIGMAENVEEGLDLELRLGYT